MVGSIRAIHFFKTRMVITFIGSGVTICLRLAGTWCSPFEIEAVMTNTLVFTKLQLLVARTAEGLVKPEAWVVINAQRADPANIECELVNYCKTKLSTYQEHGRTFISALPKTDTGKIQVFQRCHNAVIDGGGANNSSRAVVAQL